MIHLESDYNNGAHVDVLQHLVETNEERTRSYGDDVFSEDARRLIREACGAPDAQIWFLAGGTQTNATIIDSVLQSYEGVLCADTAHINVHEAGAVEFTGHKVIALPAHEGKLDVADVRAWLVAYFADDTAEHMVRPGMVYITFPTELGTLYTAQELGALRDVVNMVCCCMWMGRVWLMDWLQAGMLRCRCCRLLRIFSILAVPSVVRCVERLWSFPVAMLLLTC